MQMNLFHIYTSGRFGPEKHIGFVIADDVNYVGHLSLRYCETFDIVKSTVIPDEFWTNPESIGDVKSYRKWKNQNIGGQSERFSR